jgi:hypothetical protein
VAGNANANASHTFCNTLWHLVDFRVELKNWMITSYEVEFGPKFGSGDCEFFTRRILCVAHRFYIRASGQVFLGTCNNTQVAIRVLATEGGITSSLTVYSTFVLLTTD